MNTVRAKMIVDVFMTLFLLLCLIPLDDIPESVHIVFGLIFTVLFALIFFLNKKWFFAIKKARQSGKIAKKVNIQYITVFFLLIDWSMVVLTGIAGAIIENNERIAFVHIKLSTLGMILIFIHVFHNRKQIRSYFSRVQKKQNMA